MVEICPGLLLGSEGDAMAALTRAPSITKKHNITHILSLTRDPLDLADTVGVMLDSLSLEDDRGQEKSSPDPLDESESLPVDNDIPTEDSDTVSKAKDETAESTEAATDSKPVGPAVEEAVVATTNGSGLNGTSSDSDKRIVLKFISINDMPEADLLHLFEPCCQYIQQAIRSGGTILVHW